MINRWSAAVFVVGILAGYALSAPSAAAQAPTLPFVVGDTITLRYDKNAPESQVTCQVGLLRGDYVRCDPREAGCVEHIAFNVSRATFAHAPARLTERGIEFIQRDRGFMDSIYIQDPNGLKVELACYKFETPEGFRDVDVLMKAHALRVSRGDHHITDEHLTDAIELLFAGRPRLLDA